VTTVDEFSVDLIAVLAGRIDAAAAGVTDPHEVSAQLKLTEEGKKVLSGRSRWRSTTRWVFTAASSARCSR
jgi:hypothetical protein